MRTGKGDAPGIGFPTARRRRRELHIAAAFGGQKMASHQQGVAVRTLREGLFLTLGLFLLQNSLLLLLKVLPLSCPLSDLLFCSSFESFWLPFLATSTRLYHFYLPSFFQPTNSTFPYFPAFPSPLLFFTPEHIPSPPSTFSSPSPANPCCIFRSVSVGARGGWCPQRRLCSPI